MRHDTKMVAALAMAAALSACGGQQQEPDATASEMPAATVAATPASARPAAFAQCLSCHSVEAGKNMVGPSLHGIVGRKAASVAGYSYSSALKASGLTWDEATLDAWLASPAKLVPGNKMVFFGQPDAAKRKEVIDYMAAQK